MGLLPPVLIDAVREQRAVLFLGSGANHGALHPKKDLIPKGDQLRDLICDKFFGGALKSKPLTSVSAMASNEAGLSQFQKFIHDLFEPFTPAPYHELVAQFHWRAIATTNYDLIIERAFQRAGAIQNLVVTVKDFDNVDARANAVSNPLIYYKLHGSVDHYTDADIPLILSNEQYAGYADHRERLWARFSDLCHENHVIFAGYSISDPHVQSLMFDLTSNKVTRPMFFSVSPGIDEIEARYWSSHRINCIDATFEDFLRTLDAEISSVARRVSISIGGGSLSIRTHYKVAGATESGGLEAYVAGDVTHVHAGMAAAPQDPREFYRGNDTGWGCIQQNLDAKRTFSDSVLVDAILVGEESGTSADLFVLKGPAGNGKTVALKRIAWEAATVYDQLVLYANNAAGLRIDPLEEIYRLTEKRIILCVDHIALYRNEALELLRSARKIGVALTILATERDNEWHTYCDHLEPFVRQEFPVRYLNEREIVDLLGLLERHNALGLLKNQDQQARIFAFSKAAERQLLVALHEVTLGISFEEIILDEFKRVEPREARELYLSICALHQFGAPVRAGLISRSSGVGFEEFGNAFLEPLKNVVLIEESHSGDYYYRSRHQHVAEMVFRRALPSAEDKFDLLAHLVASINVSYSSDRETFSRLIKGRGIIEIFPNPDLGRLFYDRIEEASPDDPFVWHQRAVFELNHPSGSLVLAESAARTAFGLNPNSAGIKHTQAEVARRLANSTDDPLKKEAFRRTAREKIGNNLSRFSEYDFYTRARLLIDELREQIAGANGQDIDRIVAGSVQEIEATIQRALQSFPESAELLSAEAQFRDVLNQSVAALGALEKAFKANPRQDWLAARLAARYQDAGEFGKAANVLDLCLRDNPSSRIARFAKAKVLMAKGADQSEILEELKRSFTDGDNQYEAQFWYARELFLAGKFDLSEKAFKGINERAPGRFRNTAGAVVLDASGSPISYSGQVERLEEGYGFVRISLFSKAIFASRVESDPVEWGMLSSGRSVVCNLAFSRRGPRVVALVRS